MLMALPSLRDPPKLLLLLLLVYYYFFKFNRRRGLIRPVAGGDPKPKGN